MKHVVGMSTKRIHTFKPKPARNSKSPHPFRRLFPRKNYQGTLSNINERNVRVKSVWTLMVVDESAPRFKPSTFTSISRSKSDQPHRFRFDMYTLEIERLEPKNGGWEDDFPFQFRWFLGSMSIGRNVDEISDQVRTHVYIYIYIYVYSLKCNSEFIPEKGVPGDS